MGLPTRSYAARPCYQPRPSDSATASVTVPALTAGWRRQGVLDRVEDAHSTSHLNSNA